MRNETGRWALCLLTLLLCLTALGSVQAAASATRENVATLVRSLGYGAGIHNFKNFVLRGRDSPPTYSFSTRFMAERSCTQGCADRVQYWLFGISWSRCLVVPTRMPR